MSNNNDLLNGLSVFDFTSRLPGPLATAFLADFGAEVTKFELRADPFSESQGIEPIFNDWYKQINNKKLIKNKLDNFECDIAIVSSNKQYMEFKKSLKCKVLLKLSTSSDNIKMHDINALGQSKAFKEISNQQLPFIPIMGYTFSWKIATTALSCLYKFSVENVMQQREIFFSGIAKDTIDKLAPSKGGELFLHNGKFPCNGIYSLEDNRTVALAAIEEHLWLKMCEVLEISLHSHDRFDTTNRVRDLLKARFSQLTSDEINKIIKDNNICLTLI